ncbi:heavy metal translocating P-type ATPase [Streptococcus hongkongensis]
MTKKVYLIGGMTCASCAIAVEKAVQKVPEVETAVVNLTTEKLTITHAGELESQVIETAVSAAGYQASLYDPMNVQQSQKDWQRITLKDQWRAFLTSALFTLPILYLSMGSMIGLWLPDIISPMHSPLIFALAQFILTLPVLVVSWHFYSNGFRALAKKSPNMDSLVALATSFALLYSLYSLGQILVGQNHTVHALYFESVVVILTLITLGNYFENRSKQATSKAIEKLMALKVKQVTVIKDGKQLVLPIEAVKSGDIVLVKPGEKVAVDGQVIDGKSYIDESMLTGESVPLEKGPGSQVYTGTINGQGSITIKTSHVGEETFLAQIIALVEGAQEKKAPIAKIADKVSGVFVPIVIVLSLLTGLFWLVIMKESVSFALTAAISVMIIACPCALGLATPTAIMVGSGRAAENGILFKSGEYLEELQKMDTMVFDKTGTITQGKPKLTQIINFSHSSDEQLLQDLASLEQNSEHPLAQAIVKKAKEKELDLLPLTNFNSLTGLGVEGDVAGQQLLVGNRDLLGQSGVLISQEVDRQVDHLEGYETVLYFVKNAELQALFLVADPLKEDSKETIAKLKKLGIETILLTGDQDKTAQAIADEVGIETVYSQVLPDKKAGVIASLQAIGKKVAMVGDGINDAPALALANIGISMGSGTDIAIESADIILMKPQLMDLIKANRLSQLTLKIVKENLFWAFFYNILMIPVAMGVLHLFGGPLLNPMLAGLAMSFSSVSVVLNALRLKIIK